MFQKLSFYCHLFLLLSPRGEALVWEDASRRPAPLPHYRTFTPTTVIILWNSAADQGGREGTRDPLYKNLEQIKIFKNQNHDLNKSRIIMNVQKCVTKTKCRRCCDQVSATFTPHIYRNFYTFLHRPFFFFMFLTTCLSLFIISLYSSC